jgi:hypothetical protein
MPNAHLIEDVGIQPTHISNNQLRVEQQIDDLSINHAWACDLVGALNVVSREMLVEDRLDIPSSSQSAWSLSGLPSSPIELTTKHCLLGSFSLAIRPTSRNLK